MWLFSLRWSALTTPPFRKGSRRGDFLTRTDRLASDFEQRCKQIPRPPFRRAEAGRGHRVDAQMIVSTIRHPLLILAAALMVLPWPVIAAGYTWARPRRSRSLWWWGWASTCCSATRPAVLWPRPISG